jgi:dienelactone hydrolase
MLGQSAGICSALLLSLIFIATGSASQLASATSMSDVDHEKITIWSQGVRLAGDIYKPKGLKPTDKLPGILLIPGWGGSKKNLETNYAPHFAEQGFVVLTFDFKSWGESDGPLLASQALPPTEEAAEATVKVTLIRKIVNPISMSEDVRAALHYLGGEPQVISDNLGIWGTSMGGGLALPIAATDDRIKAYVDQMGPINYKYNLKDIPDTQMRQAQTLVARGVIPPFPGPGGTANPQLRGYPDWAAMKRFDPLSFVDRLDVPTLIIDAEDESLFDTSQNGLLLYEAIKDRVEARYVTYPGKHYDMYKGDNLREGRSAALQWFQKHLQKN